MKWFISDTHFGEERTLKKYLRPFRDILEHDRFLVEAWNSRVHPNDVVYHLGDVGRLEVVHHLNGIIKVVPGNHDKVEELLQAGLDVLEPWTVVYVKGLPVALNHDPSAECVRRRVPHFAFGHLHRIFFLKPSSAEVGVNVGVELHYFRPVSETELLYWLELMGRSDVRISLGG